MAKKEILNKWSVSMKKWKIIFWICLVIIIAFLCGTGYWLYEAISCPDIYPYSSIAGDINNWFDRFFVNFWFYMVIPFGLIGIASAILFIISIFKLKKK